MSIKIKSNKPDIEGTLSVLNERRFSHLGIWGGHVWSLNNCITQHDREFS